MASLIGDARAVEDTDASALNSVYAVFYPHDGRPAGDRQRAQPRYKRRLDVVGASFILVLSTPLLISLAILVKLSSRGPVLFKQERLGVYGHRFQVYKFRTMYHNADPSPHREYFKQYLHGAPAPGERATVYKLRSDPRITPIGSMLRRLGLDELPQLLNVIRGEMSLVGPRPPLPYEVEHYSQRHLLRLAVKPGLTGLWQLQGRDRVDFETMVGMDLDYIERQSLRLDIALLLLTIPALVRAYFAS